VMVDANGREKASVMIYKGLGEGLAVTADVAMCLLRKAEDIPFATLSLSDEDHISIRHVVFGEAVTRENLSMLLRMFAASCGDIEDELTMQFR
jgi:hypothetical protein